MDMQTYDLEVSKDWERAQSLLASGESFEATISASNSLGLVVNFGHLHGFIPAAQIVSRPRPPAGAEDRMPKMPGMKLQLKVIEADKALRRLVFSER
jgi:small subunit ribosomal protein S1